MSPTKQIRQEIERAMNGARRAFRGVVSGFRHRGKEPILVHGEGLAGEPLSDVELYQHAGFVSGLPAGTKKIVLPLGGKTVHSVIIATEYGAYRVEVGPGECALYHLTEPDCHIHLQEGRVIKVRCRRYEVEADEAIAMTAPDVSVNASAAATFNTPTLTTSNDLIIGDDATIRANSDQYTMTQLVNAHNGHRHKENDVKGQTDPPDSSHVIAGA